jgi:hypothetical protein
MSAPRAPSWTCPFCGDTPTDPRNEQYEWCERCQGYTADPIQNAGFAWVGFVGGDMDGAFREQEMRLVTTGDEWQPDGSGAVYRWDGTQWVYVRDAGSV